MSRVFEYYLNLVLLFTIYILNFKYVATVEHGIFTNVTITSGLSSISFTQIPIGSKFIVYQLHSPFNPILASVLPSFDKWASQMSTHIGLAAIINNSSTDSTLYLYSPYDVALTAWVKVDAYGEGYPFPGGCGNSLSKGVVSAVLSTNIMSLGRKTSQVKKDITNILSYWTSCLNFIPAAVPTSDSNIFKCPYFNGSETEGANILYHLYGARLITAGGAYGAFCNPDPHQVASVIKELTNNGNTSIRATLIHSFRLEETTLKPQMLANVLIARRPSTAYVLNIVVEYLTPTRSVRVPYTPVILFGCPSKPPTSLHVGNNIPRLNSSVEMDCTILPKDAPLIYFPVAVLLLASLCFAVTCNVWIWPRCAVSLMLIASVIGLILFYRYSSNVTDTYVILVTSAVVPAILALSAFVILWWYCIRPTLYYQRIFGRGPLMKAFRKQLVGAPRNHVSNNDSAWTSFPKQENLVDQQNLQQLLPVVDETNYYGLLERSTDRTVGERDLHNADPTSLVQPLHSSASVFNMAPSLQANDYVYLCGFKLCPRSKLHLMCCSYQEQSAKQPSANVFSLKPRRLARLPPILPATFVIVACLSVTMDRTFSLNSSPAAFLSFAILMSCPIMGLLFIYKNFAFGLSTAVVGIYFTLSCICLFFIPGALLPHFVIEYFLMLTWVDLRLPVLRINYFGKYDVILVVCWVLVSLVLGLISLCLIRLQDARELAETQHNYAINNEQIHIIPTYSKFQSELVGNNPQSSHPSFATRVSSLLTLPNSEGVHSANTIEYANNIQGHRVPSFQRFFSQTVYEPTTHQLGPVPETQPLLQTPFGSTYGTLTTVARNSLMPLSRVQLAAVGAASGSGLSLNRSNVPVKQSSHMDPPRATTT